MKFPNPASRYALVGVFVAKTAGGVRVAVTGAGENGVFRAKAFEAALNANFSAAALDGVSSPGERPQFRHPCRRRLSRPPHRRDGEARGRGGGLRPTLGNQVLHPRRDKSVRKPNSETGNPVGACNLLGGRYCRQSNYFVEFLMEEAVSAADANRKFSLLLRGVREGRRYVVTSHGRPVARLIPAGKHDEAAKSARADAAVAP